MNTVGLALSRLRKQFLGNRTGNNLKSGPFRRFLSLIEADTLARKISSALQVDVTGRQVQNVAATLRDMERRMIGRVAGDVDDHVLNYFMIHAACQVPAASNALHGEIGVLFGGSLLMTLHALRACGSERKAIAIDPFEGYYDQGADPVTGLPVTLNNVKVNLDQLGFDAGRVLLVKAKSESLEALRSVERNSFVTLWIDGDHSYEGIRQDWQNYAPLIVKGGFVLIDNYHDGDFPGVDRFVDQDLLPHLEAWEVVTKLGRSILFRRNENRVSSPFGERER